MTPLPDEEIKRILVVMAHPLLNHNLGFEPVAKPLDRQTLVAKLPVEALCCAVLPRLSRIDQGRLNLILRRPLQQSRGHELGAGMRLVDLGAALAGELDAVGRDGERGARFLRGARGVGDELGIAREVPYGRVDLKERDLH